MLICMFFLGFDVTLDLQFNTVGMMFHCKAHPATVQVSLVEEVFRITVSKSSIT